MAMSSRNTYLNKIQRKRASVIFETLNMAKSMVRENGETNPKAIEDAMVELLVQSDVVPDYAAIRDPLTLGEIEKVVINPPKEPAAVPCEHLIITSVSNWGGYGLVAALAKLSGKNLLPSVEEEAGWVKKCVDMGVVDGFTGEVKEYVDGFSLEEYGQTLAQLHKLLAKEGVPAG